MHNYLGLALSSTVLLRLALALPADASANTNLHRLFTRQVKWDSSCDGKIPGDKDGKLYKTKAGQAFADAAAIANIASSEKADGKVFTDSTADKDDKKLVTQMMSTIYANNIPDDSLHSGEGYTFTVKCGSAADKDNCPSGALAATNPRPDAPSMTLCDKFFDPNTADTKNDLNSKKIIQNPSRTTDSWCKTGNNLNYFQIAGLTAFHEMTHLDLVGNKAGLPSEEDRTGDFSSHGTIDIAEAGTTDDQNKYKSDNDYWSAAQRLNNFWKAYDPSKPEDIKKNYKPVRPATQNAESFAAAALEFYFQTQCDNLKDGIN